MSKVSKWQIAESFKDLYRIYQPDDLDKFTKEFMTKYKIPKEYSSKLKALVTNSEDNKENGGKDRIT